MTSSIEAVLLYKNPQVVARFLDAWALPPEEAESLFDDLKKWLWLCAKIDEQEKGRRYVAITEPLKLVDEMWHAFVLNTRDYREFCDTHFGRFVEHQPTTHAEHHALQEDFQRDPERFRQKQRDFLQWQYEQVYDHLGEDTLVRWYETHAERYTDAFLMKIWRWSYSAFGSPLREQVRVAALAQGSPGAPKVSDEPSPDMVARAWKEPAFREQLSATYQLPAHPAGEPRPLVHHHGVPELNGHYEHGTKARSSTPQPQNDWKNVLDEVAAGKHRQHALPPAFALAMHAERLGLPFANVFSPFLGYALVRLASFCEASRTVLSDTVVRSLVESLTRQLRARAIRVLLLELNVERVHGRLEGDTPQDRFHYFSTVYCSDERQLGAVLQDHPVLGRYLSENVVNWLSSSIELLARLQNDWLMLRDTFHDAIDLGSVESLEIGMSDAHRAGRSVALVRFSSGLKLLYKPRSLAVDVQFQRLLGWVNSAHLESQHKTMKVLDRIEYGWCEYVEHAPCLSTASLERFYWRQGSLLALLFMLDAEDVHYQNIIAAGEFPVVIDLEALFHPHRTGASAARGGRAIRKSILDVGLLPSVDETEALSQATDTSGLSGGHGMSPDLVPEIVEPGLDTMRIAHARRPMKGSQNRPTVEGRAVDAAAWEDSLVRGFTVTYQLLCNHKETVVEMARAFSDVEVRYLVRSTPFYVLLQQDGLHSDFMQSHESQEQALLGWLSIDATDQRVVRHEMEDLLRGDVPYFTSRPGQRFLCSSMGERIPDFFAAPAMVAVIENISAMSDADCARQVELIRRSLGGRACERRISTGDVVDHEQGEGAAGPYVQAAIRLAEDLLRHLPAIQVPALARDLVSVGPGTPMVRTDLYGGWTGVALFFAELGNLTNDDRFTGYARAVWDHVERLSGDADGGHPSLSLSVFTGAMSRVYLAGRLASLWRDDDLVSTCLDQTAESMKWIGVDLMLDVLSGSAGWLILLLRLFEATGDARFLDAGVRCGERLLETALRDPHGNFCWTNAHAVQPLAGFAHGAAGFACSLLYLYVCTQDVRYRAAALSTLAYERSLYMPDLGKWRDLRFVNDPRARVITAWCNGASGIALGRLLGLRGLQDDPEAAAVLREEIDVGLRTTLCDGFGRNHNLCHGDLGNIDILLQAADLLGEDCWRAHAYAKADVVVRSEAPYRLSSYDDKPCVGLLDGLAGIGYGLLRLAAPHRVPSVLALEISAPRGR